MPAARCVPGTAELVGTSSSDPRTNAVRLHRRAARRSGPSPLGLVESRFRSRFSCVIRSPYSGRTVATISIASDRRDRDAQPGYVDLVVWDAEAKTAANHLVEGQAVSFCGRLEPREYVTSSGDQRVALELDGVDIEHGPKPSGAKFSEPGLAPTDAVEPSEDDIHF
ncbi:MAG: single-stranded DNA-binding protein [Solirubrobacteraceae bacterium]